jgi:hypothetical protein
MCQQPARRRPSRSFFGAATGHETGDADMVQHEIETEPDPLFTGRPDKILELIKPFPRIRRIEERRVDTEKVFRRIGAFGKIHLRHGKQVQGVEAEIPDMIQCRDPVSDVTRHVGDQRVHPDVLGTGRIDDDF